MDHYKLFIDGEFVEAANGEVFESIDPGTGAPFATVAKAGKADVEAAIGAARRAFDSGAGAVSALPPGRTRSMILPIMWPSRPSVWP